MPNTILVRLLILFCLTELCISRSYSQVQPIQPALFTPYIRPFSKQDYQAYNQNWSLAQDPKTHFLYVANSKGLLEFDGNRWVSYRLPRKQVVRSVAVDSSGRIYTGGLGEVGYWEADPNRKLKYHSLNRLIANIRFPKEEIWNIVPGPDFVFFQSFSVGYLYQKGRIREVTLPGNVLFLTAVNQRFFLQAIGKGLFELVNGRFYPLPGTEGLGATAVHTLLPYGPEGLLIGTRDHGLFRYKNALLTPWTVPSSYFLQRYQCNKGSLLANGTYAFGTILNGLIVADTSGSIVYHLSQREGLQNNTVLSLTTDARGNLWTGLDDGIDVVAFSFPFRYFNDPGGQLGTLYDAALVNGKLYLGTNRGVFWCTFPTIGAPIYHFVEGSQGQVWDLAVLDGQLLCGHNTGTYRITPDNAWRRISSQAGGWCLRPLQATPGFAVQGTYAGLSLYQRDAGGQWVYLHQLSGFTEPVRELWESADGTLWLRLAHDGLYRVRLSPDLRRVEEAHFFDTVRHLPEAASFSVFEHGKDLYLAADSLMMVYRPASNRFVRDQSLRNLFRVSGEVRKVFDGPDEEHVFLRKDGSLLIAKSNGPVADFSVSNFSWMENYENVVPLDTSLYLLCFEKGFAILPRRDLSESYNYQSLSRPLIRKMALSGTTGLSWTFRTATELSRFRPVLNAADNSVVFQFSLPHSIQMPLFSYRLLGQDHDWSAFGKVSEKEYTNLAPGLYTFQVRSRPEGPLVSLSFEVLPPWYQTAWAKLAYFLIGCGFIGVTVYVHRRQLRAQQRRVQQEMEAKMRREQEMYRQHLIQLQKEKLEQDIIGKSEELANTTMSLIHKNELLLRLKGEAEKLKEEMQQRTAMGHVNQLIKLIDANISSRQDWKLFEKNFNKVHEQFFKRLLDQYDGLTPSDLRLAAYLRMNLSSKEIAKLLNITVRGVELKRYRLRKRLNLSQEANLNEFMIEF